jgi:prepilin peptidase CpaA
MLSTALLLVFLAAATYTDVRRHKIYNWITYSGIVVALILNAVAALLDGWQSEQVHWLVPIAIGLGDYFGGILGDGAAGLLICGFTMVVCFVFFPGGVGGGDVKLIAMMGAFLGTSAGLEAMLWTFILGGAMAVISLVWQVGAVNLVVRVFRYFAYVVRLYSFDAMAEQDRQPFKTKLFLAPSALAAVVIVYGRLVGWG